jgi:ribonuclease-3
VVAQLLYDAYPQLDEGSLSRLRSQLVSKDGLARVAQRFALGPLLLLGTGERKSGGRQRSSILSDTVEAIAGAVLTEAGFGAASRVVAQWFIDDVHQLDLDATRDAKTQLQEWLQGRHFSLPCYEVVSITGDDHSQVFEVSCVCEASKHRAIGIAPSRKKAEQQAASDLLEILINE